MCITTHARKKMEEIGDISVGRTSIWEKCIFIDVFANQA